MVSKDGIRIDPLNIVAILDLPAPTNLLELHHFICNFVEKSHGYMRLLKKELHSIGMTKPNEPLIILNMLWLIHPWYTPPDYSKDFLLYITSSATTIAMFLVQDNLNS